MREKCQKRILVVIVTNKGEKLVKTEKFSIKKSLKKKQSVLKLISN